ncbi:MAG: hypothetical protein WBE92_17175, partial [Steroidobacteraceae bacterium]
MTRKPKSAPASKKRTPPAKPVKLAALKKVAAATVRDRKTAAPKRPTEATPRPADNVVSRGTPGAGTTQPESEARAGSKNAGEKRVLGIERRVTVISEDHQSQIKLL